MRDQTKACSTLHRSKLTKVSCKNGQGSTKHFLIALKKGSMQNQHSCGQGQHCWLLMMCPHECKHWQPQLCRDQPAVMQLGLSRHSVSSSFPFLFLYWRHSAILDLTSGAVNKKKKTVEDTRPDCQQCTDVGGYVCWRQPKLVTTPSWSGTLMSRLLF